MDDNVHGCNFQLLSTVSTYSFLLTSAEIISEMISIAKEVREADKQGEKLNMTTDELAFYDALGVNEAAREVIKDETLFDLARLLVERVKANTSIDWNIKESVRANLKVIIKRVLREYGYPPDIPGTKEYTVSVDRILSQAELLTEIFNRQ